MQCVKKKDCQHKWFLLNQLICCYKHSCMFRPDIKQSSVRSTIYRRGKYFTPYLLVFEVSDVQKHGIKWKWFCKISQIVWGKYYNRVVILSFMTSKYLASKNFRIVTPEDGQFLAEFCSVTTVIMGCVWRKLCLFMLKRLSWYNRSGYMNHLQIISPWNKTQYL